MRRGSLDDLDVLRAAAASSDGVIHLAFKHDLAFTGDFQGAADADRRVVEAVGDELAGSDRPLLIASGTLGIAPGRLATEHDGHESRQGRRSPRPADALADGRARARIRRPRRRSLVRDDCRRPCTATATTASWRPSSAIARTQGISGYIADGANRWPAVHRFDAARSFRLALETAPPGSTLHPVADEGVPVREIAELIGRRLDIPVASISLDKAADHFGWLAHFLGIDAPASSALTRDLLDWEPTQPGLIDDLEQGHYFRQPHSGNSTPPPPLEPRERRPNQSSGCATFSRPRVSGRVFDHRTRRDGSVTVPPHIAQPAIEAARARTSREARGAPEHGRTSGGSSRPSREVGGDSTIRSARDRARRPRRRTRSRKGSVAKCIGNG